MKAGARDSPSGLETVLRMGRRGKTLEELFVPPLVSPSETGIGSRWSL